MKNVKQEDANTRLPLHLCPPVLQVRVAAVMKAALRKPGRYPYNYQETSSLTTYLDAAKRHIAKLEDGEWLDQDSGEPHAAAVAANMAVILHCDLMGTLQRDLPGETGQLSALIDEYQTKYKAILEADNPGVVSFEDGKDCGDPDCKASECLQTRVERMSQRECPLVPAGLVKKGWKCTRGRGHEGPCAAVRNEIQCEDCMLLLHEEPSVCVRINGEVRCDNCWDNYGCHCDKTGVSPTTPCKGCPRWNGEEPSNPVLDMINQVTPRKCKKFSCGNNAYMGGDLCYDCIPF